MRTIATIEIVPGGSLWADLVLEPACVDIRRIDGGLVRVGLEELGHLADVLMLARLELLSLVAEGGGNEQMPDLRQE